MTQRIVHILRTGLLNYSQGLTLQQNIAKQTVENEKLFKNVLILTEFNPVYTIGIRTRDYTIQDEEKLKALGAEFFRTNRGGLITFHGPGQLVAYPILHLKHFQPSMRWYVCHLEKTIIEMCAGLGITARTTEDTGVWVENRKICALGIHGSRYITTHGLALNCETNLQWFDHIVPCGIVGKGVTSITKELNRPFSIQQAIPLFLENFQRKFDCKLVELSPSEAECYLEKL